MLERSPTSLFDCDAEHIARLEHAAGVEIKIAPGAVERRPSVQITCGRCTYYVLRVSPTGSCGCTAPLDFIAQAPIPCACFARLRDALDRFGPTIADLEHRALAAQTDEQL